MKVVHITPTYFDQASIIGGGERYPTELALWMSRVTDTTLVSFSAQRQTYRQGDLKVEIYPVNHFIHGNRVNPLSWRFLPALWQADVVHVHHLHTLISDLACLLAYALGKAVFVTDYGGGGSFTLNRRLPVFEGYRQAIAYSQFGLEALPTALQQKAVLIKGGIDTDKFSPAAATLREKKILYVGRLLPHKGIDYLIEGFRLLKRSDYRLQIIGRVYSQDYYAYLKQLAADLAIEFVHDADDQRLIQEYRTAMLTVLPSVHTSYNGNYTPVPELMGFTLLESQACGTPVICTDAGAMAEFVKHGQTGLVVAQNSGDALCRALQQMLDAETSSQQKRCQEWIAHLNWSTVVAKHLQTYSADEALA
ncbi:MAG: glycosyltransferase family 4 protein [Acidobacteria bacterium]|nr:glycosyltransferase family 4 protein [Acidobacteriota bacterium]